MLNDQGKGSSLLYSYGNKQKASTDENLSIEILKVLLLLTWLSLQPKISNEFCFPVFQNSRSCFTN